MADLVEEFMMGVGMTPEVAKDWKLYTTILVAALFLYPLGLMKTMSGINYFSLVSIVAVAYVVILLIVEWYPYY